MYKPFAFAGHTEARNPAGLTSAALAQPGQLDALLAFEPIGMRRNFVQNDEIYGEGDRSDGWYRVVSGTVRICKLMADGRRHVSQFCFAGDCFGLETADERTFAAEAVDHVAVVRYPRRATERLIDENPRLAGRLCDMTLRGLAHAQGRMLLLGRMTAAERVASFLLEMHERSDARRLVEIPMPRNDIADYLGLTVETVCRVLSAFKRAGAIVLPSSHRIELRDRDALMAICEA